MEILSTGEKIKRARVYKGLTLRELCKDKISVSKMSCIENNKITAEPWILELVSESLDIDLDYLKKDIKEHLIENYNNIRDEINCKDIKCKLKLNIEYAETYKYYDVAMKFIHLLVDRLLKDRNVNELKEVQSRYYEIYKNAYSIQNQVTYFIDLADFLYLTCQYEQAANYFKNVRLILLKNASLDFGFDYDLVLCNMIYRESECKFMNKDYKKTHDLLLNNEVYIVAAKENLVKFKCYAILAFLCYMMQENVYRDYRDKALLFYVKNDPFETRLASQLVVAKVERGEVKDALKYVDRVMNLFPEVLSEEHITLIFTMSYALIKAKEFDKCLNIITKAVDNAILLDDLRLIEEAYYVNGLLAIEQKNQIAAETNMSISLDYLKKIGSKDELYNRYMKLGIMYYNFNNVKDSLKYFNLALNTDNSF